MHQNAEHTPDFVARARSCQGCGAELSGMRGRVCRPCTFLTLLNFRIRTELESELLEDYEQDTREHRARIEELTELLEWRIALHRGLVSPDQFIERYPDVEL